jgi:hypothetical protein
VVIEPVGLVALGMALAVAAAVVVTVGAGVGVGVGLALTAQPADRTRTVRPASSRRPTSRASMAIVPCKRAARYYLSIVITWSPPLFGDRLPVTAALVETRNVTIAWPSFDGGSRRWSAT